MIDRWFLGPTADREAMILEPGSGFPPATCVSGCRGVARVQPARPCPKPGGRRRMRPGPDDARSISNRRASGASAAGWLAEAHVLGALPGANPCTRVVADTWGRGPRDKRRNAKLTHPGGETPGPEQPPAPKAPLTDRATNRPDRARGAARMQPAPVSGEGPGGCRARRPGP